MKQSRIVITGLDKEFPTAFEGPRPIEGKPAPEIHEGTEAEAGMKPGSAAKIMEQLGIADPAEA